MTIPFDALYALQFGGSIEFAMSADLRWLHREHLAAARRRTPGWLRTAAGNSAWHLHRAALCRRELALPEERDLMILRIRAGVAAKQVARTPQFPVLVAAGGAKVPAGAVAAGRNPTPRRRAA